MPLLINLTKKDIYIQKPNGKTIRIPQSGSLARANYKVKEAFQILDGVPVRERVEAIITGIPDYKEGEDVLYIVPGKVLDALQYAEGFENRMDIISPATDTTDDPVYNPNPSRNVPRIRAVTRFNVM